jgi:hypothetical protein
VVLVIAVRAAIVIMNKVATVVTVMRSVGVIVIVKVTAPAP